MNQYAFLKLPFNSKNHGFNLCSGLGFMYLFCDTNVHNVLIKSFVNIVVDEERTLCGKFPLYMYVF